VTENYAAEWKLWPHAGSSALESPFDKVALTWLLDVSDLKSGQLVLTRMELVRLLGIIQELPQDGRLWQSDALLFVQVQGVWTRNQEIMFRYSDENGALVLKLSARSDVRY